MKIMDVVFESGAGSFAVAFLMGVLAISEAINHENLSLFITGFIGAINILLGVVARHVYD